jgi:HPt (histidine-containing phosphotransfer) domain-containing protein
MTGGKTSTYMEVLALFCKDSAKRLEILREALNALETQDVLDETELPPFVSQFHALKSALGSIGAAELSKEAALLENAGKHGDPALTGEQIEHFMVVLAGQIARISAALPHENADAGRGQAHPGALLLRLKQALDVEDIGTADRILNEITEMTLDADTKAALPSVTEHMLLFELKEAARIVGGLLREDTQ